MLITPASLLFRLKTAEPSAAWEKFIELYTPLLVQWAKRLGQQDSDCADLVQDVFLILWQQLPHFDYNAEKSFHAWLKTVFLNRHRTRLRQKSPTPIELNGVDFNIAEAHEGIDPEDTLFLIKQAFRLIEEEFSPLHQQVFRLYVLENRDPEEVARELGIRPGTVYGIKSKILSRLRQEISHLID